MSISFTLYKRTCIALSTTSSRHIEKLKGVFLPISSPKMYFFGESGGQKGYKNDPLKHFKSKKQPIYGRF